MLREIFARQTNLPLHSLLCKPTWLIFIHREASSETQIHLLTDYWALIATFPIVIKRTQGCAFKSMHLITRFLFLKPRVFIVEEMCEQTGTKPKHSLGTMTPTPALHACPKPALWPLGHTFLHTKWGLFRLLLSSIVLCGRNNLQAYTKFYSREKYMKCVF